LGFLEIKEAGLGKKKTQNLHEFIRTPTSYSLCGTALDTDTMHDERSLSEVSAGHKVLGQ
jgi:hypothetical protein